MTTSMLILLLLVQAPAATALPANGAPERSTDNRDKMICKRFVETGSLVRGYKTCKTKWEWERERDNIRTPTQSSACGGAGQSGRCG